MLYYIEYIKAFACFLIINFHCDILFPTKLSSFSFGGDIGNNLFFMISGLCLANSIQLSMQCDFINWYKKRLLRILPTGFIFTLLSILFGTIKVYSFSTFFYYFIFPHSLWFVGALVIFYPIFFIIVKLKNNNRIVSIFVTFVLLHLLTSYMISERYVTGLFAMCLGLYLSKIKIKINFPELFTVLSFALYILLKIMIKQSLIMPGKCVYCIKDIFILAFCSGCILIGKKYENKIKLFSKKSKMFHIIKSVGDSTLMIYGLQSFGDRYIIKRVGSLISIFPYNFFVAFLIICIFGIFLTKAENNFRKIML